MMDPTSSAVPFSHSYLDEIITFGKIFDENALHMNKVWIGTLKEILQLKLAYIFAQYNISLQRRQTDSLGIRLDLGRIIMIRKLQFLP